MAKTTIQTTETRQTELLEAVVDSLKDVLSKIWHASANDPQTQANVQRAWSEAIKLANYADERETLLKAAQVALETVQQQRDEAIDEAEWQRQMKEAVRVASSEDYHRKLAAQITKDGGLIFTDIRLALQVLAGEKATFEEGELQALYKRLAKFGRAVASEQTTSSEFADD